MPAAKLIVPTPAPFVGPFAVVPAPSLAPAPPPLPTWSAPVGTTLHQTVTKWCQRASVQLIWNQEDLDYPIEAPLSFKGTFQDAIGQMFPLYDSAKRSFVVDGNSSQGILYVSERKK
ncbi:MULTISPECIES: TcpQ domain-containing protein [unclassified Pseudomonas]|nr:MULTISPECIES: TcpQ domain-containing protein [unclassified Pseudomonas]MEA9979995.1 TcpQ domain-containing protein [Pseudomonas sp. RTS4]MEB0198175.1 TcpQ domain-containing protein [Pseudomonas sp. 5S4]MEB0247836.1 TcpQ domain-containing protein [Pseudomonas sp. 10S5]